MKITIYELLGMVKDGKAPKKIKYINSIWEYEKETKDYFHNNLWLFYSMNSIGLIEREVEIIEKSKVIPEKLNIEDDGNTITLFGKEENEWTILDNVEVIICNKINEICDYLKSKGE